MKTILTICALVVFATVCGAAEVPTNALQARIVVYKTLPNGILCTGTYEYRYKYFEEGSRRSSKPNSGGWVTVKTMRDGINHRPLGPDEYSLVYIEEKPNRPLLDDEVLKVTIYRQGTFVYNNRVLARYTTKP